jgi:hypothetical protein
MVAAQFHNLDLSPLYASRRDCACACDQALDCFGLFSRRSLPPCGPFAECRGCLLGGFIRP